MADQLDELNELLQELSDRKRYHKIDTFEPYPKQADFFALGATKRERLLRAGNQEGKTYAGAAETAYHLTGDYPKWWLGRRFTHPVTAWAAGESSVLVRDKPQAELCGKPGVEEDFGTGFIPKEAFVGKPSLSRGVTDAYDTIQVRHKTNGVEDGVSTLTFKSYEQGRTKFQSGTLDFAWCDEEPPDDIYSEILARITATNGMVFTTFTPLKGMSTVVSKFINDPSPDRSDTVMTIYDAKHIKPEDIQKILAGYPAHQRDARAMGVPFMGSGRIFNHPDDMIAENPIPFDRIPREWVKLWGIDFGINHPFAGVLIAWDKDQDVIHVVSAFRMSDALVLQHADKIRSVAENVPIAWPQDGTERRDDGKPLADHYKRRGLLMLPSHATFPDGSISTEAGILEMDDRMTSQRFKVFSTLMNSDWGQEFRDYHRDEDGKIDKRKDDIMSATRIAVMAKRFAKPVSLVAGYGSPRKGSETRAIADGVDTGLWGE
jgi:phage terminase large subunit-like protein